MLYCCYVVYPIARSAGNPADEGLYPDGAAAEAGGGWCQQSRGGQVRRGGEALLRGGQGEGGERVLE